MLTYDSDLEQINKTTTTGVQYTKDKLERLQESVGYRHDGQNNWRVMPT